MSKRGNEPIVPAAVERALQEAEQALALAVPVPLVDRRLAEEVRHLGDRYGYGALMSTASAIWRTKLDDLAGGEFVCGPCRSTADAALASVRAAMAEMMAR